MKRSPYLLFPSPVMQIQITLLGQHSCGKPNVPSPITTRSVQKPERESVVHRDTKPSTHKHEGIQTATTFGTSAQHVVNFELEPRQLKVGSGWETQMEEKKREICCRGSNALHCGMHGMRSCVAYHEIRLEKWDVVQ